MDLKGIIISGIFGIISGVIGFFIGRPKNRAEIKEIEAKTFSSQIDSLKEIINSWRERAMDLEKIVESQAETIRDLQTKIEEISELVSNQCDSCSYKKKYKKNA
jgi:flagellar capping protein FliD